MVSKFYWSHVLFTIFKISNFHVEKNGSLIWSVCRVLTVSTWCLGKVAYRLRCAFDMLLQLMACLPLYLLPFGSIHMYCYIVITSLPIWNGLSWFVQDFTLFQLLAWACTVLPCASLYCYCDWKIGVNQDFLETK